MKNIVLAISPGLICYTLLTYLRIHTFGINLSFLISNIILFFSSLLSGSYYLYLEKKENNLIPLFFLFFSAIILIFNLSSNFSKWRFSPTRTEMVKNINVSDVRQSIKENDLIYYNQFSKVPSQILIKYGYVLFGGLILPRFIFYNNKKTLAKKFILSEINIKYTTLIIFFILSLKLISLPLINTLKTNYLDLSTLQSSVLYSMKSLIDLLTNGMFILIGLQPLKGKKLNVYNIIILNILLTIFYTLINSNGLMLLILTINSIINLPTIFVLIFLGLYLKKTAILYD